jgi:NAD kinase
MQYKKILEVYSEKLTEKHLGTVERVKGIVEGLGMGCQTVDARDLQESCFKGINLVVAVGGDGTIICSSHYLRGCLKEVPILGINSEPEISEGALASIDEGELGLLEKMLQEGTLIKRQRALIKRNGVVLNELALNDVYVGSQAQFTTSRYKIKLNGTAEEHRSSGIIVATGSGSNAWYKSAGGSPFHYAERKLKFITREPIVSRVFKPQILRGEVKESEKLTFEAKRYGGGMIAIDSCKTYDFNVPDAIEVCLSDSPLNVIVKQDETR